MIMLCLSFVANAQYEKRVQSTYPSMITKTIVRQYVDNNDPYMIGYVETLSDRYFFQTDSSMQVLREFTMLQGYYVTDFEI